MAGQREHLEPPVRAEPQRLAAAQADVDRRVPAELVRAGTPTSSAEGPKPYASYQR